MDSRPIALLAARDSFAVFKTGTARSVDLIQIAPDGTVEAGVKIPDATTGHLLGIFDGKLLASIDGELLIADVEKKRPSRFKPVLRAATPGNCFWHAAASPDGYFVQEYGESPTFIYRSSDLSTWAASVSNTQVDPTSRHFHFIAYDRFADSLVASLGDANRVRVARSQDGGQQWDAWYTGAWQSVPIHPEEDGILFGIDSTNTSGILRWDRTRSDWRTSHVASSYRGYRGPFQMNSLTRLENSLFVASFGMPQVVGVSMNLKDWHVLQVGGLQRSYDHHVGAVCTREWLAAQSGTVVQIFRAEELKGWVARAPPDLPSALALSSRAFGVVYSLRERILRDEG